jgi:hypothetical protein
VSPCIMPISQQCKAAGCTSQARAGKVCHKHSVRSLCSMAGCNTYARGLTVCHKHGARGICSVKGCQTAAKALRGTCHRHRPNKPARRNSASPVVPPQRAKRAYNKAAAKFKRLTSLGPMPTGEGRISKTYTPVNAFGKVRR